MFIHNFKYTLKTLFKNKMLIFWTFAFPIILGTLFNLAFSDIESSEQLKAFDIALVEQGENVLFKESFEALSSGENKLFNILEVTLDEAVDLLENDEITGYVIIEESPKIVVKSNGINQTVLKNVVDEINQLQIMISNTIENQYLQNMDIDYEGIYEKVIAYESDNINDISKANLSYTMIEFYTLIAMTCLYGGILGMTSVNQSLANMSSSGKRLSLSPTSKRKLILSNVLASYIVQVIGIAILFVYTIFALKVDYGNNLPLIILLTLTGCLAGLSLGISIATVLKTNEGTKLGIILAVTMLGSFLSGMMGISMKYIVDKNIPIINKLNPANMITDGFYALYYYDTLDRFYFDVISLVIFSVVLLTIATISLRRQKYDSV